MTVKHLYIEQRVQTILLLEMYADRKRKSFKWALDEYMKIRKNVEKEVNKKSKKQ